MKTTYAMMAIAASLDPVSATFKGIDLKQGLLPFIGANPFTCPSNTDNKCVEVQVPGFSWGDLPTGNVGNYGGCGFKGWSCEGFSKRDHMLSGRTFGNKVISGSCGDVSVNDNPVISAGSEIGGFSIDSYHVSTEFDARLEFHYGMPDGSTCKHSNQCSSKGTTIYNKQCGGAKTVKVVYPKDKGSKKKRCGVKIHTISFDCNKHKTTTVKSTPPATKTSTPAVSTPAVSTAVVSTPAVSTPATSAAQTTPGTPPVETVTQVTTTYVTTFSTTSTVFTTSTKTISSCEPTVTNCPLTTGVSIVTVTIPVSTTVCPVTETRTAVNSTPVVQSSAASSAPPAESSVAATSSAVESQPPVSHVTTIITTYSSTSTVFTTSTKTISSCEPTVTNCPLTSGGVSIVTVTIPVSTTVCPVTETQIKTHTQPAPSEVASSTAPAQPTGTLPCPSIVPQCMNTWLHLKKDCKDNMDAACYCPSKDFTDAVFACMYSFGQSADITSEAIQFFQGICAPYINKNPGIATGAETITSILTVTAAPQTSVAMTTVVVDTTVTEPCVTGGTTISGSSTVRTVSTAVTVPQVSMPTAGPTGGQPAASQPAATQGNQSPGETAAPAVTTPVSPPVGTGGVTGPNVSQPPVVAGAAGLTAGLGLAVVAAVLAL